MTLNSKIDLYTVTVEQVRAMMNHFADDSPTLHALMDLESAIINGDEEMRADAIRDLAEEVIIKQGLWWV